MMEQPPFLVSTMEFKKECELVLHIPFTSTVFATGFNYSKHAAAAVIPEVDKMFGTMGIYGRSSIYYSPKKA